MKILPYLMSAAMLLGANALFAQSPTSTQNPASGTDNTKSQMSAGEVSTAKQTVHCQHIITECKKLGFQVGESNEDNGVWIDCFEPVVMGKKATRDGKPVSVPVNESDLKACKAALASSKTE